MDNERIIKEQVYPVLTELGLRQNREKFYLDDAGHRGFSVDVGSSYGEVLIRVENNGVQIERIAITSAEQVEAALDVVALAITAKKAEANS